MNILAFVSPDFVGFFYSTVHVLSGRLRVYHRAILGQVILAVKPLDNGRGSLHAARFPLGGPHPPRVKVCGSFVAVSCVELMSD